MGITHAFVSGKADGGDATLVRPTNWNADHVGYGLQPAAAVIYYSGSTYYAIDHAGVTITSGSDFRTVVNAALADAAAGSGGVVQLPSGIHVVTGGYVDHPAGVWLRGEGNLPLAGFETQPTKGTILKSGTSDLTQVIRTNNSYGARISDLVVDCNNYTTVGILMNGYQMRVHDVQVWKPKAGGSCIKATGGTAGSTNYMDYNISNSLLVGGANAVKGIYAAGGYTNNCSDGVIGPNMRMFGCNSGMIDIETGGWVVGGPTHITGNLDVAFGIRGSNILIDNIYIDSVGAGPHVSINGDQAVVTNLKFDMGAYTAQTSAIVLAAGAQAVTIDNILLRNSVSDTDYMPLSWFVDLGANPVDRGIMIGKLNAVYMTVNPLWLTDHNHWAGSGTTHYETSAAGYFYEGAVYASDIAP